MKIVLVRPNYKSHIITPPINLGYLSAYLKKHNIQTKIIDGLRDDLASNAILERITNEKPDVVGITCLTAFYKEAIQLSRLVKEQGISCIIGGVHPTFLPYQTLIDSNADYVICGEGEIALLKFLDNNLVNNNIRGIYSRQNLKSAKTKIKKAEIVKDLDTLPFPDWGQINPNWYSKAPHGAVVKNFPVGVILTTRGCPYSCSFCASPAFYEHKIRFRSPRNVVQEIRYLTNKFGVKEIHFEDDNLTFKREHILEICQLILKQNIKITWACPNGIRADKIDANLLSLMKKSGCYHLAYGIESANQKILDNTHKKISIGKIKESIRIANRLGISSQGFFIFGLPGETLETIKESISLAKETKLTRAQFLLLDILPGSELWETLRGQFTPNWGKNSFKEPEWVPNGLTKAQLMQAQTKAFRQFYFRISTILKFIRFVRLRQLGYLVQRFFDYRIIGK